MIKSILCVLFMVICSFMVRAQDFAPTGAKWYYGAGSAFSPNTFHMWIESVGDTMVAGRNCQKLMSNYGLDCSFYSSPAFVYHEDSAVYFYEPHLGNFQTLYDFKLSPGESWKTVFFVQWGLDSVVATVDSVDFEEINGRILKQLYVTYEIQSGENWGGVYRWYNAVIGERLGDMEYLFRLFTSHAICDGTFSLGLRCYEDPEIGFYSTEIAPTCEYQWVSVGDEEMSSLSLHPNPTNGHLKVTGLVEGDLKVHVIDCTGREVMNQKLTGSQLLDISRLRDGIYLFRFEKDGAFVGVKRIVKTS